MSKYYHELSQEKTYEIEALLRRGTQQKEIAEIVGTTPSTICLELKRNIYKRDRGALIYTA